MDRDVLIDTNILIRLLVEDDLKLVDKAEKLMNSAQRIIISDVVITEINYILSKVYNYSRADITNAIKLVKAIKKVYVEPYIGNAINIYNKTDLSLVDCILIARAEKEGIELATFDKDMLKYYNKHKSIK